jgi:DNA transformation protein
MQDSREFVDYVIELLGPFGTVEARRMFSGHGIFLDGLMFAIVADEALWFKADEINEQEFRDAGCERFSYVRGGRAATMSFYRAPPESLESPAEALPWARSAYAAALRVNAKRAADEQRRAASPRREAARRTRSARPGAGKSGKKTATTGTPTTARAAPRKTATKRAKRPTRHRGTR